MLARIPLWALPYLQDGFDPNLDDSDLNKITLFVEETFFYFGFNVDESVSLYVEPILPTSCDCENDYYLEAYCSHGDGAFGDVGDLVVDCNVMLLDDAGKILCK